MSLVQADGNGWKGRAKHITSLLYSTKHVRSPDWPGNHRLHNADKKREMPRNKMTLWFHLLIIMFVFCTLEPVFGQIVSKRVKTLSHTKLVASRDIEEKKSSLPVDVPRSKTFLLKLSNITPNTLLHFGNGSYNLSHSFCREHLGFWKERKVDVSKKCDQEGEQKEKGPLGGGVSHAPPLPLGRWLWEFHNSRARLSPLPTHPKKRA